MHAAVVYFWFVIQCVVIVGLSSSFTVVVRRILSSVVFIDFMFRCRNWFLNTTHSMLITIVFTRFTKNFSYMFSLYIVISNSTFFWSYYWPVLFSQKFVVPRKYIKISKKTLKSVNVKTVHVVKLKYLKITWKVRHLNEFHIMLIYTRSKYWERKGARKPFSWPEGKNPPSFPQPSAVSVPKFTPCFEFVECGWGWFEWRTRLFFQRRQKKNRYRKYSYSNGD